MNHHFSWAFRGEDGRPLRTRGEMLKKGGSRNRASFAGRKWQKRFFALDIDRTELRYYDDAAMAAQKGVVQLTPETQIQDKGPRDFQLTACKDDRGVMREGPVELRARDSDEKDEWTTSIAFSLNLVVHATTTNMQHRVDQLRLPRSITPVDDDEEMARPRTAGARASTRASMRAAMSALEEMEITCGGEGSMKWRGVAAVGTTNTLFCAPYNASTVLVIDAETKEVATIECEEVDEKKCKWTGIAAVGNTLFCAPFDASEVLVIDATTKSVSAIDCAGYSFGGKEERATRKWMGIAAVGNTLFCAPFDASSVLVIDATTMSVSTVKCGVEGDGKWSGIAAVGRTLFCAPHNASSLLVVDAKTKSVSKIECGVDGPSKWSGIAAVGDTLFCAPYDASSVLVVDTKIKSVSTIECGITTGDAKWSGIVAVGPTLYCAPYNASPVLAISSKTKTLRALDRREEEEEMFGTNWSGIAAAGETLFCAPQDASSVLVIHSRRADEIITLGLADDDETFATSFVEEEDDEAIINSAIEDKATATGAALNDNAKGGIDRFGYRSYAKGLAEMLHRAEPPVGVGIFAKWGAGKSFMISLLKKEFDPTAREHTRSHDLVQWFEKGYEDLPQAMTEKDEFYAATTALLFSVPEAPLWLATLYTAIIETFVDVFKVAWALVETLAHLFKFSRVWHVPLCASGGVVGAIASTTIVPRIMTTLASSSSSWKHTFQYLEWLQRCSELALVCVGFIIGVAISLLVLRYCERRAQKYEDWRPWAWRVELCVSCGFLGALVFSRARMLRAFDSVSWHYPKWLRGGGGSKLASVFGFGAGVVVGALIGQLVLHYRGPQKNKDTERSRLEDLEAHVPLGPYYDGETRKDKEYIFVDFNAWEYAGSNEVWTGLVANLYNKVESRIARGKRQKVHRSNYGSPDRDDAPIAPERGGGVASGTNVNFKRKWRVRTAMALLKRRYGVRGLELRVFLFVGIAVAFVAILFFEALGISNAMIKTIYAAGYQAESVAQSLSATVAAIVAFASSFTLVRQTWQDSETSRGDYFFAQAKSIDSVRTRLGFMSQVKFELNELFDFLRDFGNKTSTELVIVCYVDDLDRCLHGRNVKLLEAMQLILSVPGAPIIAFLAIDSRIVVASIEDTFGEVMRTAYVSGWEYLDKIIQIPFALPDPDPIKVKRYVDSCLDAGGAKPDEVARNLLSFLDHLQGPELRNKILSLRLRSKEGEDVLVKPLFDELRNISKSMRRTTTSLIVRRAATKLTTRTKALEEECVRLGEEGLELVGREINTVLQEHKLVLATLNDDHLGIFDDFYKWSSISAVGDALFCAPYNASSVLVIAAKTKSVSTIEFDVVEGYSKWSGIAAVGDTLFCAPFDASEVLVIDAKTKSVSTIECGSVAEDSFSWSGIAAVGDALFCAPYNASSILVIAAATKTVSTIKCGGFQDVHSKWCGIAAVGDTLFCAPYNASEVLVIDSNTKMVRTIECGGGGGGNFKWSGIAAVGDALFCAPYNASSVLVIDSRSESVSTIECGVAGRHKWSGIAAVGETLFCAPYRASSVLVIDAKTKSVLAIECGVEGYSKWRGIATVGNTLFCAPYDASSVLVFNSDNSLVARQTGDFLTSKAGDEDASDGLEEEEEEEEEEDTSREMRVKSFTLRFSSFENAALGELTQFELKKRAAHVVSSYEMDMFQLAVRHIEPNPRRLKRIVNTYQVILACVKYIRVTESHPQVVIDDPKWNEFQGKLIKWICLCECYPYRISLLILTLVDQQQIMATNAIAAKHPKKDVVFTYRLKDEEKVMHTDDDTPISTAFFEFAEHVVYSHELSAKLLRLDGDNELFAEFLTTPVRFPDGEVGDITIGDILGPQADADAGRDATWSLLSYSFNLNPALRIQLGDEVSSLVSSTSYEMRLGNQPALPPNSIRTKRSIAYDHQDGAPRKRLISGF
ncbi:hypothetical protein CTAYLR_003312 [Chrysophaeum taylorii]|uniref:PH domain-containing protein n=1 Tax=Chrysophaeum taylorii TaxID=2483200 RepID=A0AAD7XN57_9STRA|nr:hypothetical protein CTAYLR_003312 [Chrysophaeum taylorii]